MAVAIALRNRYRRSLLDEQMREDVTPKNIIMIGPTGVGKTEIARRLAKIVNAPFVKVEATKYTEVGYVGRDVESMVRDLVEEAVRMVTRMKKESVAEKAREAAEERVLDCILPNVRKPEMPFVENPGNLPEETTKEKYRKRLREGKLDNLPVEIDVEDAPAVGAIGMVYYLMERKNIIGAYKPSLVLPDISNTMAIRFKGLTKSAPKNQGKKVSKLLDSFVFAFA